MDSPTLKPLSTLRTRAEVVQRDAEHTQSTSYDLECMRGIDELSMLVIRIHNLLAFFFFLPISVALFLSIKQLCLF